MDMSRMRLLDRWLGLPACWLLTCWRRLTASLPNRPSDVPKRILFIKLAEQGSTVLAQPALRSACARVGPENVFFLVFQENRPILDLLDVIPERNVITIDARSLWFAVRGAIAAIIKMRQLRFEAAIDLEFFARSSAALCFLSGARCRVGYHGFSGEASYRGNLMTHPLSFNPYLHTSPTFQMMVEALDQPPEALPRLDIPAPPLISAEGQFVPEDSELEHMQQIVNEQLGADECRRLVLLNANASDLLPLRRWSSERYVELAQRLLLKYPELCIAFTGAPREAQAISRLADQVGSTRCFSLAGKTTLRQLLVMCSLADVLVTNDSGPAHFASLTTIDVVVLFGPETPRLFAPVSSRTHPLWAGIACSPCINAYNDRQTACTDNVCMQRITVEQVLAKVSSLYEQRQVNTTRRFRESALPLRRAG